ncbi:4-hydroxybenzoate polyprenyltransferase [Janthinobacterium sp. S3M3]|nr:4-hydroxybenzoate polyprenyltransferase [Janthinobacterium sp. S3T4]MBB5613270.1 4-hydroxybenzoate polyprenyltransferase [Janthinobacterium sp. S3M3]
MSGSGEGSPKFGRLLIVLILAVGLIGVITLSAEAYYS